MKYLLLFKLVILYLSLSIFAQDPGVAKLNQDISVLYQKGKFNDAIPLAEKVISIEKKVSKKSEAYAVALTNLAQIYKEKAKFLKTNLQKFDPKDRYSAYLTSRQDGSKAKDIFRDALDVYGDLKLEASASAALVKAELAWVTYNFTISDSLAEGRSQVDSAERMYEEALATADTLLPKDADLQISVLNNFADFYMHYVNFEKAFPLYERSVQIAQGKYGARGSQLLAGLYGLHDIYVTTDREGDSNATLSRIADITGRQDKPVIKYRYLDARSRGFAKVKAEYFFHRDYTDLDRSYRSTSEMQRKLTIPGQTTVKFIEIEILVSEDGSVSDAKVITPSKYTAQVEEAALASKFRPFEYNGKRQKIRGKINFYYREY